MIDSLDARKDGRERIARETEEFLNSGGTVDVIKLNEAEVKAKLREKFSGELGKGRSDD